MSKFIEAANMVYTDLYATRIENGGSLDISIGDIVSKIDADYDEYEFQNAGASTQTLKGFKKLSTDDDETLITSIDVPKGETITVYPVYSNGSDIWYAKIQGAWRQVSYNSGKSSIEVGEVIDVNSTNIGLQATVPENSGLTVTPNSTNTAIDITGNTAIANANVSLTYNNGTAKTLAVTIKEKFAVTFMNYDGSITLGTDSVMIGEKATYSGEVPTRESNGSLSYTFEGWSLSSGNIGDIVNLEEYEINDDIVFYAKYTEVVIENSDYLVDNVVIGDYVDINLKCSNYTQKWRVLNKNGNFSSGTVKLVSTGGPLMFQMREDSVGAVTILNDLSSIMVNSDYGHISSDRITGRTGNVNLLEYFTNPSNGDCYKYFDSSKGIHAIGCNSQLNGTISGTNTEIEDVYTYITGDIKKMADFEKMSSPFSDSNLKAAGNANGKNWGDNPRWTGLLYMAQWCMGGSIRNSNSFWSSNNGSVGGTFYGHWITDYVRIVISLQPGVKILNGTGENISNAYILTK